MRMRRIEQLTPFWTLESGNHLDPNYRFNKGEWLTIAEFF